jgi:uncharacterized membrane protein
MVIYNNRMVLWAFCGTLSVNPWFTDVPEPILLLQVFAHRYRMGTISPAVGRCDDRTVEQALRAIGQTFAGLGSHNPRLDSYGHVDFRLRRQLTGYGKAGDPPSQVKPLPIAVLLHAVMTTLAAGNPESIAVANMITIAFFFLMRPGEHTAPSSASFQLQDVMVMTGTLNVEGSTMPVTQLAHSMCWIVYTNWFSVNEINENIILYLI